MLRDLSGGSFTTMPSEYLAYPESNKRFQVLRACERCKRLRRGCSDFRPCLRCVESKLAHNCKLSGTPPGTLPLGTYHHIHPGAVCQQIRQLLPSLVIDHCVGRFFEYLYTTMPILNTAYIACLRSASRSDCNFGLESLCVLLGLCGRVLLQSYENESEGLFRRGLILKKDLDYGLVLLGTATSVWTMLPRHSTITIEVCLLTFFIYASEIVLLHHSRACRYLRETTTLLLLYRNEQADELEHLVSSRLFHLLLITERSHAILYSMPVTLQINEVTPGLGNLDSLPPSFLSLVTMFRALNTPFIALLNQETSTFRPTPEYINSIEIHVNSDPNSAFSLHNAQDIDVKVTRLWLRIVIWKLRLRLGHLVVDSSQKSLTFRYPIEVAKDLVHATRDLPTAAFNLKAHGVAITEKFFDISIALINVLACITTMSTDLDGEVFSTLLKNDLPCLQNLIRGSPNGDTIYNELLQRHIQHTMLIIPGSLVKLDLH